MRKGFTLIELLVVVLIIGILAAIALPQYQVAVAKARFVQMQVWGNAIWEAEQIYYMENGKWSSDFNELVLNLGGQIIVANVISFGEQKCTINGNVQVICENRFPRKGVPIYFHGFGGRRVCRASSALEGKVCRSLGGVLISGNCSEDGTNYCQYRLP